MELIHYAEEPITLDRTRTYAQGVAYTCGKPHGLWVSVQGEDDWPQWCRREDFAVDSLKVAHKVVLKPSAAIAYIRTPEELDTFHAAYAEEDKVSASLRDSPYCDESFAFRQWPLNWGKVAADCDGIIITPYLWSRRLDGPMWYYGWDCASGCIWNLDAIDTFGPVDKDA